MTEIQRRPPRTVTYAGFGLAIALLALAGAVSWRTQQAYQEGVNWTSHTYEVLDIAQQLSFSVQRAEADGRGYALTGLPGIKTETYRNIAQIPKLVDSLRSLVADNPLQSARLDTLGGLIADRLVLVQRLVETRDSAGQITISMSGTVARGDQLSNKIRRAMRMIMAEERSYLTAREGESERRGVLALFTMAGALVLALIVLGAATSVTLQELSERERAEEALQQEAERQAVMIQLQQAIATASANDSSVLDLIVDQVMALTSATGAALTFVDGDVHVAKTARGDLVPWLGIRNPLADSLTGSVLDRREPEVIADNHLDPRVDRSISDKLGTRSTAILPIISGDKGVGALVVSAKVPNAFGSEDLTALQIMSGILSAGVTNATAYAANERLLAELRRSRDAAEEANRAKSSFLATMSHELRTPLNSVIGFSNLLLRNRAGNLAAQDIQFLERIKDNGTHLLTLINDILDVSKIEAGRMEVQPVPTDLGPLIRDTLAQIEGQKRERPIAIRMEIPEPLLAVEVDPARFKQVLINLVGNALKFTEEGSVTVRVTADPRGHPLGVDVVDTGVGIPQDRLDAIFEAFTQADATTERRFGGTGLGLTISRQLLRLMGADLTVSSVLGKGSTFTIQFPASAARGVVEEARQERPAPPPPELAAVPLILIIDDESDARTLLRTYLQDDGYHTAEAADGESGLEAARRLRPKLITLDLRMPRMSGIEFLRQLRADPEISDIPVLVISIEAGEQRGAIIGAVDVLAKPVGRDSLLGVVQRILPNGRRRVLVVDDDVHTRQLFTAVLGSEGYQVRTARDGLEAFSAIEAEMPDLLILDLMMPVMDGGTFLATLRRNPRYAALPVVVVTALDADSDAVRRLDGAAQAVVQKGPALEKSLRDLLQSVLGGIR